ncbi:MAG TPA: hypothetical protein VNK96_03160 [Fimbriimonadales bacterium]|nr:hypothetical protein [Fimbriimonadales bacterium]
MSPEKFDQEKMDQAASKAAEELRQALEHAELLPGIKYVSKWFDDWYLTAGYKRLARALRNLVAEKE